MFLRNPKVGVVVERFGNKKDCKYKLTKDKPILIPAGTEVVPIYSINDNAKIFNNSQDELLQPTGNFWITTGTIDPYHIILDIF